MLNYIFLLLIVCLYCLALLEGRKGFVFFISGIILNFVYTLYRFVRLGHLPLTDKHDLLVLAGFLCALCLLSLSKSLRPAFAYIFLLPSIFIFLSVFYERIDTISPVMNSKWFYLYMVLFITGFSLISVGSAIGIAYIYKKGEDLEFLQYQYTLAGWLIYSLSLISGSVWFFLAYGSYWLWTAKELWFTITWFYYGFYLHGRYVNLLKGDRIAEVGVAGIFILFFSFLWVTPVLGSPWTQF